MDTNKDIIVIYHANCPDGFGAAYAAWKIFRDTADYIAVSHGNPPPLGLENKEIYIVDFSYPKDILLELEKRAKKLVVLDHHIGTKEAVEATQNHIFDNDRSGAGIAWTYFHPETPLPRLLAYIQDRDLWKHELPHGKEIGAYLGTIPFTFDAFDAVAEHMEDDASFETMYTKGGAYSEYYDFLCTHLTNLAEEVRLGEHTILAVNAPRFFRSEIGHRLARIKAPFGIVWYQRDTFWHFSLRGDGSIDLSLLTQQYGGNGHHNAASFAVPIDQPLPFTFLKR